MELTVSKGCFDSSIEQFWVFQVIPSWICLDCRGIQIQAWHVCTIPSNASKTNDDLKQLMNNSLLLMMMNLKPVQYST